MEINKGIIYEDEVNTSKIVYRIVRKAIKRKELKPEPCLICKDTKVVAHHDDYRFPFQITWLCRKHHMERHKALNGGKVFHRRKLADYNI